MIRFGYWKSYFRRTALLTTSLLVLASASAAQTTTPVFFQPNPGAAEAHIAAGELTLSNSALRATWQVSHDKFSSGEFRDLLTQRSLGAPVNPFVLLLSDGRVLTASDMKITEAPAAEELKANPAASKLSEQIPGKAVSVQLRDDTSQLTLTWRAILRDGSAYIRQEF